MRQLTILSLAVAFFSFAFINPKAVKETYNVDVNASTIEWIGRKVLGEHNGTIKLKEGSVEVEKNTLIGGTFVIDMSTINNEDLSGNQKGKLEGHLKSDDFFGVKNYPTATIVITEAIPYGKAKKGETIQYKIEGNLTIKGKSKAIKFPAEVMVDNSKVEAQADITVDRSEYDVKYGSGSFFDNLGDKTIYDEFDVKVNFVAKR
ncbi:MAG TPA: YceI family protein [Cyclobacteriaceae bacterium]